MAAESLLRQPGRCWSAGSLAGAQPLRTRGTVGGRGGGSLTSTSSSKASSASPQHASSEILNNPPPLFFVPLKMVPKSPHVPWAGDSLYTTKARPDQGV